MKTKIKQIGKSILVASLFISANTLYAQENPLERWAEYNVDELNTFAKGDVVTAKGKLYQWGRNIAFPLQKEVTKMKRVSNLNDSQVLTEKYIVLDNIKDFPHNWYNGGQPRDGWGDIVKETLKGSANDTYLGVNDGDPCPEGYRLPRPEELKALVYELKFTNEIDGKNKTETRVDLEGRGRFRDYKADYKNIDRTTTVALRFKGPNAMAFKYEWVLTKGLKIYSKPAGDSAIEAIADSKFDWSDAVQRFFPTSGFRNFDSTYQIADRAFGLHSNTALKDNTTSALYFVYNGLNSVSGRSRVHGFSVRCVKK